MSQQPVTNFVVVKTRSHHIHSPKTDHHRLCAAAKVHLILGYINPSNNKCQTKWNECDEIGAKGFFSVISIFFIKARIVIFSPLKLYCGSSQHNT